MYEEKNMPQMFFAKRTDGVIISIREINKANKGETYYCPACGTRIVPWSLDSASRQPHFHHMEGTCTPPKKESLDKRFPILHKRECELMESEVNNLKERLEGLEFIFSLVKRARDIDFTAFIDAVSTLCYDDQVFIYDYTRKHQIFKVIREDLAKRINQNAMDILKNKCPNLEFGIWRNDSGTRHCMFRDTSHIGCWDSVALEKGRIRALDLTPGDLTNITVKAKKIQAEAEERFKVFKKIEAAKDAIRQTGDFRFNESYQSFIALSYDTECEYVCECCAEDFVLDDFIKRVKETEEKAKKNIKAWQKLCEKVKSSEGWFIHADEFRYTGKFIDDFVITSTVSGYITTTDYLSLKKELDSLESYVSRIRRARRWRRYEYTEDDIKAVRTYNRLMNEIGDDRNKYVKNFCFDTALNDENDFKSTLANLMAEIGKAYKKCA